MIDVLRKIVETPLFGVCTLIGEKMGIRATRIRLYFIYLSFFTFGSPVIVYFILAFLFENRKYFNPIRPRRPSVWDL